METHGIVPLIIRIPALQAAAVLLPVFVMLYWLWRIRSRRTLSSLAARERYQTPLEITPKGQVS
jgi:hypothetical protein